MKLTKDNKHMTLKVWRDNSRIRSRLIDLILECLLLHNKQCKRQQIHVISDLISKGKYILEIKVEFYKHHTQSCLKLNFEESMIILIY